MKHYLVLWRELRKSVQIWVYPLYTSNHITVINPIANTRIPVNNVFMIQVILEIMWTTIQTYSCPTNSSIKIKFRL